MAKTKEEKNLTENKVIESTQTNEEEANNNAILSVTESSITEGTGANDTTTPVSKEEHTSDAKANEAYNELLSIVQMLAKEVQELKGAQAAQAIQAPPMYTSAFDSNDRASELINLLANRRSDKEVVIVHNCELIGGLTAHLDLTGLTIDFRALGE